MTWTTGSHTSTMKSSFAGGMTKGDEASAVVLAALENDSEGAPEQPNGPQLDVSVGTLEKNKRNGTCSWRVGGDRNFIHARSLLNWLWHLR